MEIFEEYLDDRIEEARQKIREANERGDSVKQLLWTGKRMEAMKAKEMYLSMKKVGVL